MGPGVVANAPGRADLPVTGDMSWALGRLRQAQKAGLIGEVPTPDDRDLPAAWRHTSQRLAEDAQRKGYSLTRKLAHPNRLDPRLAEELSKALKGIW